MELEVGMYVRSIFGNISKVKKIYEKEDYIFLDVNNNIVGKQNIAEASHDITDLIEKDDILTFKNDKDVYKVSAIPNEESGLKDFYLVFEYRESLGLEDIRVTKKEMQEQLESIMTHEKFEKESYKIGEK